MTFIHCQEGKRVLVSTVVRVDEPHRICGGGAQAAAGAFSALARPAATLGAFSIIWDCHMWVPDLELSLRARPV
eukprot:59919-Prymnesium_polylepis.1